MKFSKPLVLLLGGILSASSLGCAAITAVVCDSRPVHRETRSNADRLVAIGRVFENQGCYDKAEVVYRKAQALSPQDASIRSQLEQLVARRKEKQFGPSGTADAIAMADAVRPPERNTATLQTAAVSETGGRALAAATVETAAHLPAAAATVETAAHLPAAAATVETAAHLPVAAATVETVAYLPVAAAKQSDAPPQVPDAKEIAVPLILHAKATPKTGSQPVAPIKNSDFKESLPGQWKAANQGLAGKNLPDVAFANNVVTKPDSDDVSGQDSEPRIGIEPQIALVSASTEGLPETVRDRLTADDVMVALESPEQHVELLLAALANGCDTETRSLAATLLGDCDPGNAQVRDALNHQHELPSPPDLLLAVCDSQIERGESSQGTIDSLIRLCTKFSAETQIQAVAQLRNFSGTRFESLCVGTLSDLLSDEEPAVRAAAAVTLGDFSGLDSNIVKRLRELTADGANENVREAAGLALARQ